MKRKITILLLTMLIFSGCSTENRKTDSPTIALKVDQTQVFELGNNQELAPYHTEKPEHQEADYYGESIDLDNLDPTDLAETETETETPNNYGDYYLEATQIPYDNSELNQLNDEVYGYPDILAELPSASPSAPSEQLVAEAPPEYITETPVPMPNSPSTPYIPNCENEGSGYFYDNYYDDMYCTTFIDSNSSNNAGPTDLSPIEPTCNLPAPTLPKEFGAGEYPEYAAIDIFSEPNKVVFHVSYTRPVVQPLNPTIITWLASEKVYYEETWRCTDAWRVVARKGNNQLDERVTIPHSPTVDKPGIGIVTTKTKKSFVISMLGKTLDSHEEDIFREVNLQNPGNSRRQVDNENWIYQKVGDNTWWRSGSTKTTTTIDRFLSRLGKEEHHKITEITDKDFHQLRHPDITKPDREKRIWTRIATIDGVKRESMQIIFRKSFSLQIAQDGTLSVTEQGNYVTSIFKEFSENQNLIRQDEDHKYAVGRQINPQYYWKITNYFRDNGELWRRQFQAVSTINGRSIQGESEVFPDYTSTSDYRPDGTLSHIAIEVSTVNLMNTDFKRSFDLIINNEEGPLDFEFGGEAFSTKNAAGAEKLRERLMIYQAVENSVGGVPMKNLKGFSVKTLPKAMP